jgi:hypothetical protein
VEYVGGGRGRLIGLGILAPRICAFVTAYFVPDMLMSPTSEKTLSNRTSSKKYYEKYVFYTLQSAKNALICPRNKEKEREKARLRMAALRNNTRMAVNPVKYRFSSKKLFEQ